MVASASDEHILLVKKLGGLFSVIIGCPLTTVGETFESTSRIVVGVPFLALGAVLLTLKIIRRNQRSPLG
jgi:hypothetical protein